MKLGTMAGAFGKKATVNIDAVKHAESLGYDSVWTAEAYGNDAVTIATWVLCSTTKIKAGSGAAVADAVAVVVAVAAAGRIATAIAIVTGAAGVRAAVATTGRSIARDQHRHMTAALRFSNRAPRLVQRGPGGLRGTARRPRPAPRSGIDGRPCRPHRQPFPSSDRTCSCVADRWRSVPRRGAPG